MQTPVKATYMRGGTSKGTFFNLTDLPERCQVAGSARDDFFPKLITQAVRGITAVCKRVFGEVTLKMALVLR